MGQKIKRSTQCGNQHCGKLFTYTYDMERIPAGVTSYTLSCPFCQTRQRVPLQSVRKVEVLKDGTQQEITELTLPEHPIGKLEE
ncbi:MAG: hypothetical protein ACK4RS_03610 [Thiothrix sp.]